MQDRVHDEDDSQMDAGGAGRVRLVVKVWASDTTDEKPMPLVVWCDPSAGGRFGVVQARVAKAYSAKRPGAAPLRFIPVGVHVATNAARVPVFNADQKISDVLAQCATDAGNEIHVIDIHRLAAAYVETAPVPFVPLLPAPPPLPSSSSSCSPPLHLTSSSSSSSSRRTASQTHGASPTMSRSHSAHTSIRCTADGCWVSAKDIVCDALSLWGVHSALPQNTVRRMKEQHPAMFVKRALSGGGAHAPVIDTDSIDLFCERCAAAVAPAHASAMRAYPSSERRARSMAHVLARRSQHAGAHGSEARPLAPPPPVASSAHAKSPMAPHPTLSSASGSGCASPSVSNDSDSLSPEDGWSSDEDGALGSLRAGRSHRHRRRCNSGTTPGSHRANDNNDRPSAVHDRRRHVSGDANTERTTTDRDRPGRAHQRNRDADEHERPHKRRRLSTDQDAHNNARDQSAAARLMGLCATKAHTLCVWRWSRDRRWRLATEMRCPSDGAGSPWEVLYDSETRHHEAQAHTWIDAVDAENLMCEAMASPCALVAVGGRRHLPTIEAFYADDGSRRADQPGGDSGVVVSSVLDGWLATACRQWVRAPEDRREGLGLFRRAVALGALVAGGPYASRWESLVKDLENALA
nr:hypothetical protein [Pandoravirus massiliensis]